MWYRVKDGSLGCHLTTYIASNGSGYLKHLGQMSGVTCMMSSMERTSSIIAVCYLNVSDLTTIHWFSGLDE